MVVNIDNPHVRISDSFDPLGIFASLALFIPKRTGIPAGLNMSKNKCDNPPMVNPKAGGKNNTANVNPANHVKESCNIPRCLAPSFPVTEWILPITVDIGFVNCPMCDSGLSISGKTAPNKHPVTIGNVSIALVFVIMQYEAATAAPNRK